MTAVTRSSEAVITDPAEFSLLWPRLFSRVVATLRQRGVDWASAEDAVQEAGARAIAHQVPFTSEDDLRRWVQTVAWRVAVDNHRRTARWRAPWAAGSFTGQGPDADAAVTDVAHEVEARIELRTVEGMFPLLSAADRAALLDATPPGQTRKEAVRAAVRRHRARARLVALVEGLAAAFGFLPLRRIGAWRAALVPSVAAAVLVPFVLVAPPFAGDGSSDNQRRGPEVEARIRVRATAHASAAAEAPAPVDGQDAARTAGHGARAGAGDRDRPAAPAPAGPGSGNALSMHAAIPGPPGEPDQGGAGVRPKEEGKPLLCVTAPTAGRLCTPERDVKESLSSVGR